MLESREANEGKEAKEKKMYRDNVREGGIYTIY